MSDFQIRVGDLRVFKKNLSPNREFALVRRFVTTEGRTISVSSKVPILVLDIDTGIILTLINQDKVKFKLEWLKINSCCFR